jgi:two-component system, NarL family, invasion response regulator UvrY
MPSVERPNAVDRAARVLAVDDSPSFLALLRDVVGATGELEVVGEADCGEQAIEMARELQPEMVLMDVRMPGLGGIEAAKAIKADRCSTLVVLISTSHPDELPADVEADVADAIIWKSELQPKLLDEIWLRHGGQATAG